MQTNGWYKELGQDSPELNNIFLLHKTNPFFEIYGVDSYNTNYMLTPNFQYLNTFLDTSSLPLSDSNKLNKKTLRETVKRNYRSAQTAGIASINKFDLLKSYLLREKVIYTDRLFRNQQIAKNILSLYLKNKKKKMIIPFGMRHMFDVQYQNTKFVSLHRSLKDLAPKTIISVVYCMDFNNTTGAYRKESLYSMKQLSSPFEKSFKDRKILFNKADNIKLIYPKKEIQTLKIPHYCTHIKLTNEEKDANQKYIKISSKY